MTAAARDVDDFLADLDSVLATSTAPIPTPAPGPEPTPEPDTAPPIPDTGPDTTPTPTRRPNPSPMPPEKDWWSDVYKDDTADQDTFTGNTPPPAPPNPAAADDPPSGDPEAEAAPEGATTAPMETAKQKPSKPRPRPSQKRPKPRRNQPAAPRTAWDTDPHSHRQSLVEAWARTPYRLKWLAYHASAAYFGWSAGLVDYATSVTAWIDDGRTGDPQSWFFYALAAATFLLYRRTRGIGWPIAWCAAVPVTSTVVGVLLYAPTP